MTTQPDLRIGDAEREAASAALSEHFALGRLTPEEHDQRLEQAWTARTHSQLRMLFADLPAPHGTERQEQGQRDSGEGRSGKRAPHLPVPWLLVVAVVVLVTVALPGPPWPLFILGWLWVVGAFGPRHRHGMRRWHV